MEISRVELVTKTILRLLDGAPEYPGKKFETPGKGGKDTMDMVKEPKNPHHFIMRAQSALPVDAAGNPWSGSYVHNHGNLVLDLMDNLVLEATGRIQKSHIYQMSSNKTLQFPEVKKLLDKGVHREQYTFRLDGPQMDKIFQGSAPTDDGSELVTLKEPRESYPNPIAPERPEEFAPGLDPELQALADAFTVFKEKTEKAIEKKSGPNPRKKKE